MTWPTSIPTFAPGDTSGVAASLNQLSAGLSEIGDPWTAYTPTWTASTSNPSLGNGTLSGAYILAGKLVVWRLNLVFGSSSTIGSGIYSFTLPVPGNNSGNWSAGSGIIRDDSATAYMPVVARMASGSIDLVTGAGARVNHNTPFAWGIGDSIAVTGVYEAV